MLWSDLVAALSYYTNQEQPDSSFTAATPTFVQMAEARICRDLDLSALSGTNTSLATTALSNVVNLATMTGQTLQNRAVAYAWPVVIESLATRIDTRWIFHQLVTRDFLDMAWPNQTYVQPPNPGFAFYCLLDPQTVLLAPVPDQVYPLKISGTWRPAGMSVSNPQTWLGDYLPDLLFAGVMCEAMGYQRNWGAQSDDPRAALSWEARYRDALRTTAREEWLRQGLGPNFQPYPPAAMAGPPANAGPLPPGAGG